MPAAMTFWKRAWSLAPASLRTLLNSSNARSAGVFGAGAFFSVPLSDFGAWASADVAPPMPNRQINAVVRIRVFISQLTGSGFAERCIARYRVNYRQGKLTAA